jgi:hypothetical protein
MENSSLKHFGIPGMKWGVRRFQNPDGSYTSAGKKKYISEVSKKFDKAKAKYDKNNSPEGIAQKARIKKGAVIAGSILAAVGAMVALDFVASKASNSLNIVETGQLAVAARALTKIRP